MISHFRQTSLSEISRLKFREPRVYVYFQLKKLIMPGHDHAQVHPKSPALLSISSNGQLSPAFLSVHSSSPKALLANSQQHMFNTSMASLSPSQLDQAIMEMLNIKPQNNRCHGRITSIMLLVPHPDIDVPMYL